MRLRDVLDESWTGTELRSRHGFIAAKAELTIDPMAVNGTKQQCLDQCGMSE